jgi:hypothetical protein
MTQKIDCETRIGEETTVSDIEEQLEMSKVSHGNEGHYLCDWCSKGVSFSSNSRVSHYISDSVLDTGHEECAFINRERALTQLATYCEECSSKRLLFPCEGFSELRIQFTLTDDGRMSQVSVTDISLRKDGIPWNPVHVTEKITETDFQKNAFLTGHLYGPENMVTVFLSWSESEIDIRDMVKPDGSIRGKYLGRARKKYNEFRSKMGDYSRDKFSSHVRNSR